MRLPDTNDTPDALGQLWEATRPVEPTPAAWDAVWSRVESSLYTPVAAKPAGAASEVLSFEPGPHGRFGWRLMAAAQAAAVLAALGLGLASRRATEGPPYMRPDMAANTAAADGPVEIDAGAVVLLRGDGPGLRVEVAVARDDRANGVDGYFAMFNAVEAMAE
jgi:hypothetical protein